MALTANARSLIVAMIMCGSLTTAQFFFAVATGSIALMVDCVSMVVDVFCYAASLVAEMIPDSKPVLKRRIEFNVSLLSMVVLLGFCGYFLKESGDGIYSAFQMRQVRRAVNVPHGDGDPYGRLVAGGFSANGSAWAGPTLALQSMAAPEGTPVRAGMASCGVKFCGSQYAGILPPNISSEAAGCKEQGNPDACDADDPPNGLVMITFGVIGVLVDCVTIGYYGMSALKEKKAAEKAGETPPNLGMVMLSASLHVLADVVRCLATIIAGSYILWRPGWASSAADEWGGGVVTLFIAVGTVIGVYECLKDKFCAKDGGEEVGDDSSDDE